MDKRYQVFVSSTYADLKEERQAVIQALMEMDCIPAGMELFPAADDEQWEFIKRIIDDSDYYILIIGGRYGSTTAEGISYTEKEYDYARDKGLKILAFIHERPTEITLGKSEVQPELRVRLEEFRAKASTGRLVKFWSAAKELPGLVALSLNKTIKAYPAVGWVRADKVASLDILEEVNELRKRNQVLEKLVRQENSIFTESEIQAFTYTWEKIDKYTVVIIESDKNDNELVPFRIALSQRSLISKLTEIYSYSFDHSYINTYIFSAMKDQSLVPESHKYNTALSFVDIRPIINDLLMYGFAEAEFVPPNRDQLHATLRLGNRGKTVYVYTPKLHRFKYWLDYSNLLPASLEFMEEKENYGAL